MEIRCNSDNLILLFPGDIFASQRPPKLRYDRPMSKLDSRPLSEITIDPSLRPSAPKIDGVTPDQLAKGRQLAAIHRMHLMELSRMQRVLDEIEKGQADPSSLPSFVLAMDMTQNFRTFGNLCGQECRMLSFHHAAEEQHMFPELERKANDGIRAVVKRLHEEHQIVHALIERLHLAAVALVSEPNDGTFADTRVKFNALSDVVRSHFGYEETELAEAIGVHLDML